MIPIQQPDNPSTFALDSWLCVPCFGMVCPAHQRAVIALYTIPVNITRNFFLFHPNYLHFLTNFYAPQDIRCRHP